jgi:hypothetical protein
MGIVAVLMKSFFFVTKNWPLTRHLIQLKMFCETPQMQMHPCHCAWCLSLGRLGRHRVGFVVGFRLPVSVSELKSVHSNHVYKRPQPPEAKRICETPQKRLSCRKSAIPSDTDSNQVMCGIQAPPEVIWMCLPTSLKTYPPKQVALSRNGFASAFPLIYRWVWYYYYLLPG